jgi:hypothetical protein
MTYNRRKLSALRYFSGRQWVRPGVYAVAEGIFPTRSAWSYLLRLHRLRYLNRGRDSMGRVVYHLSPRGAHWLLKRRAW